MPMIQFSCPSCNASYKVPEKAAGRQATCKSCGASMTVPKSSQGSAGGSGNVDLSGLYAGADAAGPQAPAAFGGGSVFATTPRRSGPNPMLLVGIGGAVVVLLLVVVLVVVLSGKGGGNNDGGGTTAGTTPTPATSLRDRGASRADRTNPADTDDPDDDDNPVETDNGADDGPVGDVVEPPNSTLTGVVDWTLTVPDDFSENVVTARFRGLVITLPPGWRMEKTDIGTYISDNSDLLDLIGEEAAETSVLTAAPRESLVDVELAVIVSRVVLPPAWPVVSEVDRITPNLFDLDGADLGRIDDQASSGDFSAVLYAAMGQAFEDSPVGFNVLNPDVIYLEKGRHERATYGTLMGGYPFVRTLANTDKDRLLIYAGYFGNVQVTFVAKAPALYPELIQDMDWVVRSTRLMTSSESNTYARTDPNFQQWLRDRFASVPKAGDSAPHSGLDTADWEGFPDRSLFSSTSLASTVTPYRQPYGIIPPQGLQVASTNRVAARWFPDSNGLWLEMKITKLEGRAQRTMSSPIMPAEDGRPERLFVHSTEMPLPAGYEHSTFTANSLTVHRVLLPEVPNHDIRKVYYVVFDGGNLVTVEGQFNKNRPEDLEKLDAAAATLTKV
jgi:hypothetical protein